jgi:hypothetical protein
MIERVAQRFFDTNLCQCVPYDCNLPRCFSVVRQAANGVHETWRRRAESVYGAVGRLSKSLEGVRARKSILIVSEDFIQDTSVGRPFRDAIDASQKANTAIYFLGARGLTGMSTFSVTQDVAPRPQDIGSRGRRGHLAGERTLADATGSSVTRSNDLAAGSRRMALDSPPTTSSGTSPKPDRREVHDLQVGGSGPGVSPRPQRPPAAYRDLARAGQKGRATGESEDDEKRSRRPLAPPPPRGRLGAAHCASRHVGDNDGASRRGQVVVEIDNSGVGSTASHALAGRLDLTILAAGLDQGLSPATSGCAVLSRGRRQLVARSPRGVAAAVAAPGLREGRAVRASGLRRCGSSCPTWRALSVHAAPDGPDAPAGGKPAPLVPSANRR